MDGMAPAPVTPLPSTDLPARPMDAPAAYERPSPMTPVPPARRSKFSMGSRSGFPYGTALIALVVVLISAGVLYAFSGAKVSIVPVMNPATIMSDFSATLNQGELPFQVVGVEKTVSVSVPAESTVTANDPASGKITIINKQAAPQALIKNTRFATSAGLVYRIHDSVSIPAGGNISVSVYADEPGDKYNIGPSTFTVPGLKGSKAFDLVTAVSDKAMTGGFSGTRPSVAQATKDKEYANLQATLTTELEKDLAAKVPAGYVLVPGASFPSYTPVPDTAGASGTVALSETGSITAVLFPEEALARAIATKAIGTYTGQPVTLSDVSQLLVKPVESSIAPDASTFAFNLSGSTTVVWVVDAEKIAATVASKTRESAELALRSFPEVDRATLVLKPFWARTFPADPAKIKVTVQGAEPSNK